MLPYVVRMLFVPFMLNMLEQFGTGAVSVILRMMHMTLNVCVFVQCVAPQFIAFSVDRNGGLLGACIPTPFTLVQNSPVYDLISWRIAPS